MMNYKPERNFWKGKRVFLTGHTGFKGAWLSFWLNRLGAKVYGYSLPPENQNDLWNLLDLRDITSIYGDINDAALLSKSLRDFSPEVIIHMAAQAIVSEGYKDPRKTFQTNAMGTLNLILNASECTSVRVFLNVTTDKVYENFKNEIHTEEDRLGGNDPYSASKACSEIITHAMRSTLLSSAMKIVSARCGNVVGGGDWSKDRIVPDIYRSVEAGKALEIRNPNAVRPWLYILDSLCGYLKYVEHVYQSDVFPLSLNFAPNSEESLTVKEIVDLVKRKYPKESFQVTNSNAQFKEESTLKLSSALALKTIGWTPRLSTQDSILEAVDWYLSYKNGLTPVELVERSINKY